LKELESINKKNYKPWGYYCILQETLSYKEKKLIIYPQKRISLQKHNKRNEMWFIIQGVAEIIINNKTLKLDKNKKIFIPKNAIHRVKNIGTNNLIIKELQTGDYFGEDDIIRFEDDYGRV
jgi:mannose-1-phosphate guanylyltransferase